MQYRAGGEMSEMITEPCGSQPVVYRMDTFLHDLVADLSSQKVIDKSRRSSTRQRLLTPSFLVLSSNQLLYSQDPDSRWATSSRLDIPTIQRPWTYPITKDHSKALVSVAKSTDT